MRIAVINKDKCKPKKCNSECKKKCPPNIQGTMCIEIEQIAKINEDLCIGCGMCVKVCPFNAIQIINIPKELEEPLHMYEENGFRLYKLPYPKIGKVYGIIGENGIGKSTLLGILSNQWRPNFGKYDDIMEYDDIKKRVRGTELQSYFNKLYSGNLKVKCKPQNIEKIQKKYANKTLISILSNYVKKNNTYHNNVLDDLNLRNLLNNKIGSLSGGEMQRFTCSIILLQDADVYIFDEPTNYLDCKHRLAISNLIRQKSNESNYIFLVEHDMSILDYTSDIISIMYGRRGAYGVISKPYNTGEAINMYFNGYISAENMRFRDESYNFRDHLMIEYDDDTNNTISLKYNYDEICIDNFKLIIKEGKLLSNTSMILMVGQNGTGKTTFLNHLAKTLELSVSYKRQYIDVNEYGDTNVKDLLYNNIQKSMCSHMFISDVLKPFRINDLYDKQVNKLSGGELQKVAITLCLGNNTDIYLIDEPSACLDIEQRVLATKIIKRYLIHNHKIGFIVEHDIMMVMAMGVENTSKIIVFDKNNDFKICQTDINDLKICEASKPHNFVEGINDYLCSMDITFRTDPQLKRPRINKLGSQKDILQKKMNIYYV